MGHDKQKMEKIRMGLYARVSTAEQSNHNLSLTHQTEMSEAFTDQIGWEATEQFIDSDSGYKYDRNGMDELRKKAKNGEIDGVVALRLDRFARDEGVSLTLIKELYEAGLRIFTVEDG